MPNRIEVVFEPKDTGVLSMIDKIDRAHASVARSATSAGKQMDGALGPTHKAWQQVITDIDTAGMSTRQAKQALKEYADQALDIQERIERVAASARKASSEMEKLNRAGFQGKASSPLSELERSERAGFRSNFDVNKFIARDRGPTRGPLSQSDGAVLSKFEDAARKMAEIEQVSRRAAKGFLDVDGAAGRGSESIKRLNQVTDELKQTLKEELGRGSVFGDIIDIGGAGAGGGKAALAIASITLIGATFIKVSSQMRRAAEDHLKAVEKIVNRGFTGTAPERRNRLQELRQLERDIQNLNRVDQESAIAKRLESIKSTKGSEGVDVPIITGLTGKKAFRGIGFDTTIVGPLTPEELRAEIEKLKNTVAGTLAPDALKEVQRTLEDFQSQIRENPIAKINLETLRRQEDFLEKFIDAPQQIKDRFLSLNEEIRKVEIGKVIDERIKKAIDDANEAERIQRQLSEGTERSIASLRNALTDNPLARIFQEANQRQKEFFRDFAAAPEKVKNEFTRLNKELQGLELFRQNLSGTDRLNNLLLEQERLRSGLGGLSLREDAERAEKEREAIRKEIFERRNSNTLDARTHFELLSKLGNAGLRSREDQLQASFIQRQIESAQAALRSADTAAKESLAIDRLLAATSDIGKLSEDQIEARMEALERKFELEAQAQEKLTKALEKVAAELEKLNGNGLSADKPPATVIVKVEGETSGVSVSRERLGLTTFHRGGGLYEEY